MNSKLSLVKENTFYSTITIFSRLVANVFIFWLIARFYGPEIFGQFTTAQVLATNFLILADFGFDLLLTMEIARNRSNAVGIFQQLFSLKVIFCAISFFLMNILGVIGSFSLEAKKLIFTLSFYMVFSSLSNFISALFKGFEKLVYETRLSLLMNMSLIIISMPMIFLKMNILFIAITFVLTRLLGFMSGVFYAKSVIQGITFKFILNDFNKFRNKILVFGFFLLFNNLFFQLDTILLSLWKNDTEVGIYQAAFKLIMLPLIIPDIMGNTLLPTLSRLNSDNKEQWLKISKFINKLLVGIVIPISIIMFVDAKQIVEFIYGLGKFSDSAYILQIFSLTLFIRFAFEAHALMLTTSGKQNIRLVTVIIATILNFAMNYFLIPLYGAFGASLVSLFTNIFVGVVYFIMNYKLYQETNYNLRIIFYLVFSLLIAYLFWLNSDISILISLPVVILLFSFIIYFFYLNKEEKKIIFESSNRLIYF